MISSVAKSMFFKLLPRSFLWRLGRSMYMHARGDIPNQMSINGEIWFQICLIEGVHRARTEAVTLLDIGANIGDWSANALRLFRDDQLRIIAFEPDPAAALALQERFNDDGRIMVKQLALSSATGVAKFYRRGPGMGTNSLIQFTDTATDVIEVNTDTLTNYCANNEVRYIDLIKCDAEGHDFDILLGARELLRNQTIGAFQFEYNHRWILARRYLKDVFDMIVGLPYKVGKIQPRHIIIFDTWHPELERFFEANYVVIHERTLQYFSIKAARWDDANAMRVSPMQVSV